MCLDRSHLYFLCCAVTTFILYLVLSFIFVDCFMIDVGLGVTGAYVAAVSFHYWFNRKFTFRFDGSGHLGSISRYVFMSGLSYFLQISIVIFTVEFLNSGVSFGVVLGAVVNGIFTFFVMKKWVFTWPPNRGDKRI
jgi:putative flippase GtrA